MPEPNEILELYSKRASVIKPGLERTRHAWKTLGKPGEKTITILVAGTNGKGSTSGILWNLLSSHGLKSGYFSSPHLIEFRERIAVSHVNITNELICGHLRQIKKTVGETLWIDLTFFEINTLLALCIFEQENTKINILEVGLGGRLDCTNIVDPSISVITSIGLDHQEYLGTTLVGIAREKAGIMRDGRICLWGGLESSEESADDEIRKQAAAINTPLLVYGEDFGLSKSDHLTSLDTFFIKEVEYSLPEKVKTWPSYLRRNFCMAFTAFSEILPEFNRPHSKLVYDQKKTLKSTLSKFPDHRVTWPITLTGRFQEILITKRNMKIKLLLDVCHNPHGAKALAQGLQETGLVVGAERRPAFISILRDKDAAGIWNELKDCISRVHLFKIKSERSWDSHGVEIAGTMFENFLAAFDSALQNPVWFADNDKPWLIFGSVAGIGEVMQNLHDAGWKSQQ